MNPKNNLSISWPDTQIYLKRLYKSGEISEKEYYQEMLMYFEEIYANNPEVLEQVKQEYDKNIIKYEKKKKRYNIKKIFSHALVDIFMIILHLLNTYALYQIISTSYTNWYFKYFVIGYVTLSAFLLLAKITNNKYRTIEIRKSDLPYNNYKSNIEYIHDCEDYSEEEAILKSVCLYREQLELKEEIDNTFKDFETLYKHFKTLRTEDKWKLLYKLPYEYQNKLLELIIYYK